MATIEGNTVFCLKRDVVTRKVLDEGIMLNKQEEKITVLNQTGIEMVKLLDGKSSVDALIQMMLDVYDVDRETLTAVLESLAERKVIFSGKTESGAVGYGLHHAGFESLHSRIRSNTGTNSAGSRIREK